jgi:hypothetical protein
MSFDRRIRNELARAAEQVEADIERNLGAVEARTRTRRGLSPALLLVATFVVVVLALARWLPATGPGIQTGTSPSPTAEPRASASAPPPEAAVAGTWLVTLPASNSAVQRDGVTGPWTLRLQPDGVALLSAPASFSGGAAALSGITFSITGRHLRTDVFYNDFCTSIGTYAWARSAGLLTLTPVAEDCPKRATLLATAPWVQAP